MERHLSQWLVSQLGSTHVYLFLHVVTIMQQVCYVIELGNGEYYPEVIYLLC